jgi:hypothetical protein
MNTRSPLMRSALSAHFSMRAETESLRHRFDHDAIRRDQSATTR